MKSPLFNEPSLDQMSQQFEQATKTLARLLPIAVGVIAVLWLSSGVYSVNPGHVGVVRTFGKETARTEPGLNFRFPWPFQRARGEHRANPTPGSGLSRRATSP